METSFARILRSCLSTLLLLAATAAAAAPSAPIPAAARPAGMDDADWSALQSAAAKSVQQAKLVAADGAASDNFGYWVAVSGDTAAVGAIFDDVGSNADQGSAYVFVRSGTSWVQQAKLVASDGAAGDWFGHHVALAGDTVVVGAIFDDIGTGVDQGSAYVFLRNGTTWTEQAKLLAPDGAAGDWFGAAVALSGDTALVGARRDDVGATSDQGSAHVFVRNGTAWTHQAVLLVANGAGLDDFGVAVALSGDTALVGAWKDDVGANVDQGSVEVFVRSGTTWDPQATLLALDGTAGDSLGLSLALSDDTALVGAYNDDIGATLNQGSAYVFVRDGAAWTQQARLVASDGAASDNFGYAVALSGDTALVGAYVDDVGVNINQGSAYVFVRSGTAWTQREQLLAADGAAGDSFGGSLALSGDTAVLAAYVDDIGANVDQGSAYVFDLERIFANGFETPPP
jgi:hypothetical protein